MAAPELTAEQIEERKAVLRRFRALLEQQREKFREYLQVLNSQADMIEQENVEALVAHTEIEQNIITELYTIQKVINPLEDMYRTVHPETPESDIPHLQSDLAALRTQVLTKNEENRELLKSRMQQLRQKITTARTGYGSTRGIYASDAQSASMIDIRH